MGQRKEIRESQQFDVIEPAQYRRPQRFNVNVSPQSSGDKTGA